MKKRLCLCILMLGLFSVSQNNDLYVKTFDKTDGLQIDVVNSITFDKDGFLWIGGRNLDNRAIISNTKKIALQRFNGQSFHSIYLPEFESPILSVKQIYKRFDEQFYIIAKFEQDYCLLLFNPETSIFKRLKIAGENHFLGLSKIVNYNSEDYIVSQKNRVISINKIAPDASIIKLFNFTTNENKFKVEESTTFIPLHNYCILTDDNFNINYINWEGKILKTETTKRWIDEHFVSKGNHYAFMNNSEQLHILDSVTLQITPTHINNKIESIHLNTYTDKHINTVITSVKNDTLKFHSFRDEKIMLNHSLPLKNSNRLAIFSDNNKKDLWLSTDGKLHHFKFPQRKIKTFLKGKAIRTIATIDTTNFIVATEKNGWFKLNTASNTVKQINTRINDTYFAPNASRNIITQNGKYWSSNNTDIIETNPKNFKTKSYTHYPIICLESLNDSTLVYGTKGYNLMSFNTKTKTHKPLLATDSLYIYDIEIKNNLSVCATDKGALVFNHDTKSTQFYGKDIIDDPYLLMVDYHKDLGFIFGSRSGLIYTFNDTSKTFEIIYKDDLNAGIATVFVNDNYLWINTFNGYVQYNLNTKLVQRFSDKDGFSHNEANRYSALKTNDGLLVGTLDGLNYFKPKNLQLQKDLAQLTLLKINVFDTKSESFIDNYNQAYFKTHSTIILPTENRALQLDFGLKNSYATDNGYSYKYRLNNKEWTYLNRQNSIRFPNLAAGNYSLEIVASDFSGNYVGNPLYINILSRDFFYKTWWFILIIFLIIITVLLYFLKQNQLKKLMQHKFSLGLIQSQENERKRIASELHDSISQQLTLIKRKAQSKNQEEISILTNNTLEEVRHISRGLFPPLLKQLGLTESIEQLALDIDENNDIFVSTSIENIDKNLNEGQSLHLYRFIQECSNNILKHSDAKAFSITIEKQKTLVLIQIKDNGKGFDVNNAKSKNSLGLKTLEERTRILKGELTLDSKPNKGTVIFAKIPINNG